LVVAQLVVRQLAEPKLRVASSSLVSRSLNNRAVIPIAIRLLISCGTYFGIISDRNIRTVEFLSILAIGVLTGVLFTNPFKNFFYQQRKKH
jgi:hypothetical protein